MMWAYFAGSSKKAHLGKSPTKTNASTLSAALAHDSFRVKQIQILISHHPHRPPASSDDDPSRSLSPPASTATPPTSPRHRPPSRLLPAPTRFGAPRPAPPGRHPRLPLPLAPHPRRRNPRRPRGRRRGRTRQADRVPPVLTWRVGARLGLPPALRLLIGLRLRPPLRGRRVPPPRRCRGSLAPPFRH